MWIMRGVNRAGQTMSEVSLRKEDARELDSRLEEVLDGEFELKLDGASYFISAGATSPGDMEEIADEKAQSFARGYSSQAPTQDRNRQKFQPRPVVAWTFEADKLQIFLLLKSPMYVLDLISMSRWRSGKLLAAAENLREQRLSFVAFVPAGQGWAEIHKELQRRNIQTVVQANGGYAYHQDALSYAGKHGAQLVSNWIVSSKTGNQVR
eukprot:GHVU01124249.1.p1 GENE.GHVU01124249.1~~GHVU01124249.1.p1  ORF type:complete len:209 (+),score=33.45 GHVU01124249.1:332-958(+)